MKNLARVSAVVAGVLVAAGALTVACGSSSVGILPDASADAPADHFVQKDTGSKPDTSTPPKDGGKDVTGTPDTGVDAGTDTGIDSGTDTGVDTGVDSGVDSGHDSGSGSDTGTDAQDAGVDAPPPGVAFFTQIAQAYCSHASTCCVGGASANFNEAKCVSDAYDAEYAPLTYIGIIFNGLNSSHYTFNQTHATACLNGIAALSCNSNPATTLDALAVTCASAYQADLTSGASGCLSSFDCPTGTYCGPITGLDGEDMPEVPAGGGTCMPLLALGSTCVDTNNSSDCTYLGEGTPAAYCGFASASATVTTCLAAKPNMGVCTDTYTNQECQSGQCQPSDGSGDYGCETSGLYELLLGTNVCTQYAQ